MTAEVVSTGLMSGFPTPCSRGIRFLMQRVIPAPALPALLVLLAAAPVQAQEPDPTLPAGRAVDPESPEYAAGWAAGLDAYRSEAGGSGGGAFVLGAAGGALAGSAVPYMAMAPVAFIYFLPRLGGGVGLILLGAEMGGDDPPARMAEPARAVGVEYGAGFIDGYRHGARSDRRRAAWAGAATGAAAAVLFFILMLGMW